MLTEKEEFVFFWRGPFSNWYKSNFTVNGTNYICVEQYMMAQKALLFNDYESYNKIMETNSPKEMQKLGREIKNFDLDMWEKNRFTIVLTGIIEKFSQNDELKQLLLDTGLKTLVEASPIDGIWGIKLAEDDPKALDRSQWNGLNLLGQTLTMAREFLKYKDRIIV